jgi:hypothetical protein
MGIREGKARICMPTGRNFTRRAFQCAFYEAQDVLSEIDDVDQIGLEPGKNFEVRESWHKRLLYHDFSKRLIFMNPGLKRVRLTQEYDLFVVMCPTYWDLLYVGAIEGWKDHCKTSVLWIDEMWVAQLPSYKYWLHALRQFDHVFIGYKGTARPLSEAIGKTCHWLPGAVDALRFTPYPNPPERLVDVYSVGRRWDGIHRALLDGSRKRGAYYVHDSFPSIAERQVYDHRQHRELFANTAKRSRYFTVAPGKINTPEETHAQIEVGYRYYEGQAAGTVMIGQSPDCDAYRELFPRADTVVPVQPDGSDVLKVLADLDSDPAHFSAMSRRNAADALLRHDWLYRWKEILRTAGIEPSARLAARERRLRELADMAADSVAASEVHVNRSLKNRQESEQSAFAGAQS